MKQLHGGRGIGGGRGVISSGKIGSARGQVLAVAQAAREAAVTSTICLYTGTAPALARFVASTTVSP